MPAGSRPPETGRWSWTSRAADILATIPESDRRRVGAALLTLALRSRLTVPSRRALGQLADLLTASTPTGQRRTP